MTKDILPEELKFQYYRKFGREHFNHFALINNKLIPYPDIAGWGQWFEHADRHIDHTVFPDGVRVSTVFLGFDHGFGRQPPVLFESMIFGGPHNEFQCRYVSIREARMGHWQLVKCVKSNIAPDVNIGEELVTRFFLDMIRTSLED